MELSQERQYLRELRQTHEAQVLKGQITRASNSLNLIIECEKRIEFLNKFTPGFKEKPKTNEIKHRFIKKEVDPNLLTEDSVLITEYDLDYILYSNGSVLRCEYLKVDKLGRKYNKKAKFLVTSLNLKKPHVGFIKNKFPLKKYLPRLVYTYFKRKVPSGYYIIHLDGDVMNCDIKNLGLKMRDKINPRKNKNKVA